jgi:hypothetical protein
MSIRDQIWNCLANVKHRAVYAHRCSEYADWFSRGYSTVIALATAGTVTGWWIWQQYSTTWAIVVGLTQILHIVKPYVPFVETQKDHLDSTYKFERLFLEYQRLWNAYERNEISDTDAEDKLYELRVKEREIAERHSAHVIKGARLLEKTFDDTQAALKSEFPTLVISNQFDENQN